MTAPTKTQVDIALEIIRVAGYVAIKEKSYRAARTRQRLAQCEADWERDRREGAEKWARDCCDEERRIRDRLTFVYGVARAHGASIEDLTGEQLPGPTMVQAWNAYAETAAAAPTPTFPPSAAPGSVIDERDAAW